MAVAVITELKQYLTFKLAKEVFAIDVSRVQEVLELSDITKIPSTPMFMLGVINVRGSVVPIVDMRLKFDMSKTEKTIDTCIVVMEISTDHESVVLGAVVDSVQEVVELQPDQIEPPPRIGTMLETEFIKGMGKRNGEFVIILDIDKTYSAEELSIVKEAESSMAAGEESPGD